MTVERHLVLQEKVLSPSAEWPPCSQGWLAFRIAEGHGYWLQNGLPARPVGCGDVLVLGRHHGGLLRSSQLGPLKLHFFSVLPQLLGGVLTLAEGFQLEQNAKIPARQLAFSAAESIGVKFAGLAAAGGGEPLVVRCACLQLWSEAVAAVLAEKSSLVAGDDRLRERFRQFVGEIPESELATHSLASLAGKLHCSERHFSRLFREEFGTSLRARQIDLRLLRARQLLSNSNAKIINVAYESGYRHLGLFNAMFKKRFGMTPGEWRRQHLAKVMPARPRDSQNPLPRLAVGVALVWMAFALVTRGYLSVSPATMGSFPPLPIYSNWK